MSAPFLRDKPGNFAHVFNVSLPILFRMSFFFVFAGDLGSLKTQIPQKIQKNQMSGEKRKKKEKNPFICKRVGRGTLNTCAKFQGLTLRNGVDIGL